MRVHPFLVPVPPPLLCIPRLHAFQTQLALPPPQVGQVHLLALPQRLLKLYSLLLPNLHVGRVPRLPFTFLAPSLRPEPIAMRRVAKDVDHKRQHHQPRRDADRAQTRQPPACSG